VWRDFVQALRALIRNPDTRFSMAGTSLFWGTGTTLRFLLVAWVPIALGNTSNSLPAELNGVSAIGIVIGAGLAGKFLTLEKVGRALPAGVLIGVAVCVLSGITNLPAALVIMVVVGACGGFFVVPLNALLQERGHQSVGAGNAVAVQNLAEYTSMLLMLALYTLAVRAGAPVTALATGFGTALALAMSALCWYRWRSRQLLRRSPAT
jgi:LPLT family lysophospholipid transporter-like MFS transporter